MIMDVRRPSEKLKASGKIGEVRISFAAADARSEGRIRAFEDLVFKGAMSYALQNQDSSKAILN
ncbi:MAG: hypothetical protein WC530_07035 [Candidatus Omnitrophota bacterium]|jgi:hypothetical protein